MKQFYKTKAYVSFPCALLSIPQVGISSDVSTDSSDSLNCPVQYKMEEQRRLY